MGSIKVDAVTNIQTKVVANDAVIKVSTNQVVGTVQSSADGTPDTITLAAAAAYELAIGEEIVIRKPQDNYNTTRFLSGLTPTNDRADKVDTFTLYNGFPESAPYGTEIWQVHSYDLWDSSKNTACQCDPRWTGYDCSERKCPLGDDPLTVDSIDGQGPTTTEVEMSVTVSVAANSKEVVFDGGVGLPVSELSRGDEIRIGRDIRFVETITYVDHNTKTHVKSFVVRDAYLGGAANGEKFTVAHPSASRLYRRDVSKEIREALLNVPNSRIEGVSVEKLEISGDIATDTSDAVFKTATYKADSTTEGIIEAVTNHKGWMVGDLVRIRSHIRIVTDTSDANKLKVKGGLGVEAD